MGPSKGAEATSRVQGGRRLGARPQVREHEPGRPCARGVLPDSRAVSKYTDGADLEPVTGPELVERVGVGRHARLVEGQGRVARFLGACTGQRPSRRGSVAYPGSTRSRKPSCSTT